MSMTLTEAAKLSNDDILAGVLGVITSESGILARCPFIGINGNGLTYNRLNAAPSADFYDVGDDWDESTPTFTQATAVLKILGGDADIDNFLRTTRSNIQDLDAAVLALKARAVAELWEDTFVNGDDSVDTKSFDGIDVLTAAGQTVTMGVNGGTLTLDKLDELLDLVRNGKPDALIMARRSRRKIQALARAAGAAPYLQVDRDDFGRWVHYYNDVPILVNDYIAIDKTVGTSSDCSTIHAVRWGETGVAGLHAAAHPGIVSVEDVGALETKDADRFRVKMYASVACFETTALAKLTGVRD